MSICRSRDHSVQSPAPVSALQAWRFCRAFDLTVDASADTMSGARRIRRSEGSVEAPSPRRGLSDSMCNRT
jgi:hypothetical protein